MSTSFLESKTIQVNGVDVVITQLSGLDRYNYMDYCSDLPEPERPIKPAEDASEEEQEKYLIALGKYAQKWQRLNFIAQARLVAYGYRNEVHNIDDRHNEIMSIMTPEKIAELYKDIAAFSGIPLAEDNTSTEETSTTESSEETTTQEPVDPKV
ncbi:MULTISPECIES: phage minor tail protein G [Vibrio]|jgi:hypothetical protein|uniref:phage minor tail protein G n=1 Tax=Vibrio TaxID=662 RepID=UPI001A8C6BD9|nr:MULTISPECIES: phage minor tail protein G [Vibrio]MBO0135560.1 hypothetical protein [Vibrio sp. Vb2736]HDU8571217.1 hypothetical protein [Vibrio parahaemolyticus]